MNKKHLMLSAFSILRLNSISAVHAVALLPDTSIPVHLIVETDIAKSLDLLPAKKPKQFKPATLSGIINSTQAFGIKFVSKPDLKQLLDSSLIDELKSAKSPDTAVYVGPMPTMTGDDDNGDGEIVVMVIGPQAKLQIESFGELDEHMALQDTTVKEFFAGLVTDSKIVTKSGKSVATQPKSELART